jgi:hypothetical protein
MLVFVFVGRLFCFVFKLCWFLVFCFVCLFQSPFVFFISWCFLFCFVFVTFVVVAKIREMPTAVTVLQAHAEPR